MGLIGGILLVCAIAARALFPIAVAASVAAIAQAQNIADRAFGFGSAHVNLQTPPGYLLGFNNTPVPLSTAAIGSQAGPLAYVGNYGVAAESTPNAPVSQTTNLPIVNDGVGSLIDFGDLRTFNIGFERLTVGDSFGLQTVDLCGVYWLTGGDKRPAASSGLFTPSRESVRSTQEFEITSIEAGDASQLENSSPVADDSPPPSALVSGLRAQSSGIAFVYGLRSYARRDSAGLDATGSILKTSLRTTADNEVFAPQAGLAWLITLGNWSFQAQGTALAGYNDGVVEQHTRTRVELIPGALNRPLFAQPVATDQLESHPDFSPGAEIRAETRYSITDALSLHLAWSGLFFENMLMPNKIPDLRTTFFSPDFILEDANNQRLFTQDLYCGIEYLR
jgi:Putative beta barrel porin-7 (BBP7)